MPDNAKNDAFQLVLKGEHKGLARFRSTLGRVPSNPRCKLCMAPFGGPGGVVLGRLGFARFSANPAICSNCVTSFRKDGLTGAEIPVSLLFADVRGSTGIAEHLRPSDFRAFLDRFYRIGSKVILDHDGLVDKLVGDEVIGLFFGGVTGPHHAAAAIDAGIDLVERCSRPDATPTGPIPIGAGVHTGIAYVGATGPEGAVDDFTALGDPVNTTARLASTAAAGELIVSAAIAEAAGRSGRYGSAQPLDVRGRQEQIDAMIVRP
jgi:adenylate cyclase